MLHETGSSEVERRSHALGSGRVRRAFPALLAAEIASGVLLVIALAAPLYRSETVRDGQLAETTTATLIDHLGWSALPLALAPLAVSTLVAVLLVLSTRTPARWPSVLAWALVIVLGGFSVLALASVGLALAPVAALLAIALGRAAP